MAIQFPAVDQLVDLLPSAQVKLADAEVRAFRNLERLAQGGQERLIDILEDSGHFDVRRAAVKKVARKRPQEKSSGSKATEFM